MVNIHKNTCDMYKYCFIHIIYMAAIENNAKPKQKRQTKYAGLSPEERKLKYYEVSLNNYKSKSPEEKKKIMNRIIELQKGFCEVCEKEYAFLKKHYKTELHKRNADTQIKK